MAKVERLVKLLDMLGKGEELSVKDMGRACGVSPRTIYRYLDTLNALELRTRLKKGSTGRFGEDRVLGRDDFELILFCLGHNTLVQYPYFAERFERIKSVLTKMAKHATDDAAGLLVAEKPSPIPISDDQSKFLELFTHAVLNSLKIRVTSGKDSSARIVRPVSIRLGQDGPILIVELPRSHRRHNIFLTEVAALEIE